MNTISNTPDVIKYAYLLDGTGGGHSLSWEEVQSWKPSDGRLWMHVNYADESIQNWLQDCSGLSSLITDALLAEETRPRATAVGDGLLIALRGINMNPGAEPDDMISVRLWIDNERIVSASRRELRSLTDIVGQIECGQGPVDSAGFIVSLTNRLVWRMTDTVDNLEELIAGLEEGMLSEGKNSLRSDLANLRRQTITLRRYLAPERDALTALISERISWIHDDHRMRIREVSDRLIRHIEDIDAVRERAAVTQEELLSRAADQQNKRMYVLSVVAAIFLPLGFLTGLLGINVGGIPGTDNPYAFSIVILFLICSAIGLVFLFRWRKWL